MPGFELIGEEERKEVNKIFSEGGGVLFRHGFDQLRGGSYKVRDFEQAFSKKMNSPYALAVTSGTAALRVALAALDLSAGDEVITQSFTFVATVEAIIESKAKPICAEIDHTLNLDPEDLIKKIGPKTKAVIVVHMLGVPARLREIKSICDDKGIALIEDTAWGLGGKLDDQYLGTWGRMGTFSFDFAKAMTTGEGGMVVFRNKEDYEKAAAWHDHGHENNPAVPRWEDTRSGSGFNFRMMEVQGAIGLVQLEKLDYIINAQRSNLAKIEEKLLLLPGVKKRERPEGSYESADSLIVLVKDSDTAQKCRRVLVENGLSTKILPEAYTWHFAGTWNHMKELVESHNGELAQSFPQSLRILSRAVSLPILINMPDNTSEKIYNAFKEALSCE